MVSRPRRPHLLNFRQFHRTRLPLRAELQNLERSDRHIRVPLVGQFQIQRWVWIVLFGSVRRVQKIRSRLQDNLDRFLDNENMKHDINFLIFIIQHHSNIIQHHFNRMESLTISWICLRAILVCSVQSGHLTCNWSLLSINLITFSSV